MFKSLHLGKVCGIDLYIHSTFWILPLFIAFSDFLDHFSLFGIFTNVLFVFSVFACIVLHELGHALTARGYGIGTRNITLYPIGGVAALERMPERPWREIAIALAGPAVNLVIAAALFIGIQAGDSLIPGRDHGNVVRDFLDTLLAANLVLCVFNLIPAFPMDGGRVLRGFLATIFPRVRATAIAAGVGTVVAGILLIAGILTFQPFLVILAVAVFLLGQAELAMTRLHAAGREFGDRVAERFAPREEEAPPTSPSPHGAPSPGFSGLAWDATRRVWVEWRNGIPVGGIKS